MKPNEKVQPGGALREFRALACSGWLFLFLVIGLLGFAGWKTVRAVAGEESVPLIAIAGAALGLLCLRGLFTLQPNQGAILSFFGAYVGTVRGQGLRWTIPFFGREVLSLRSHNLNTPTIKVNDRRGNPIEIAAAIVWRVEDTARAVYDVEDYLIYVTIQSESALRRMASSFAYDDGNDLEEGEGGEVTLRGGSEEVSLALQRELQERLAQAGILVEEARVTHLAYAPEIAQAMLRRQQAEAIISARRKIVKGAVGIVEMAIAGLSEHQIVELDEDRKAALVSNLLVVLCGESEVMPIVNTGSGR